MFLYWTWWKCFIHYVLPFLVKKWIFLILMQLVATLLRIVQTCSCQCVAYMLRILELDFNLHSLSIGLFKYVPTCSVVRHLSFFHIYPKDMSFFQTIPFIWYTICLVRNQFTKRCWRLYFQVLSQSQSYSNWLILGVYAMPYLLFPAWKCTCSYYI